jgi:hypothetical protein
MTRLNITLSDQIAEKLAKKPNKSRFIAEVLKEKFEDETRKEIESQMAEGYKATNHEDREMNNEWEKVSLERWD